MSVLPFYDLAALFVLFSTFLTNFLNICFRLAHALARSFNFQGRVKKIFYVLTDDKVGAGPRLRPHALVETSENESAIDQPMETDTDTSDVVVVNCTEGSTDNSQQSLTLSAKLAAQALKRKATEPANPGTSKSRR